MKVDEQIEFIEEQQFKVDSNSKEDLAYEAIIQSLRIVQVLEQEEIDAQRMRGAF